jgi:hypothetical protein
MICRHVFGRLRMPQPATSIRFWGWWFLQIRQFLGSPPEFSDAQSSSRKVVCLNLGGVGDGQVGENLSHVSPARWPKGTSSTVVQDPSYFYTAFVDRGQIASRFLTRPIFLAIPLWIQTAMEKFSHIHNTFQQNPEIGILPIWLHLSTPRKNRGLKASRDQKRDV